MSMDGVTRVDSTKVQTICNSGCMIQVIISMVLILPTISTAIQFGNGTHLQHKSVEERSKNNYYVAKLIELCRTNKDDVSDDEQKS